MPALTVPCLDRSLMPCDLSISDLKITVKVPLCSTFDTPRRLLTAPSRAREQEKTVLDIFHPGEGYLSPVFNVSSLTPSARQTRCRSSTCALTSSESAGRSGTPTPDFHPALMCVICISCSSPRV